MVLKHNIWIRNRPNEDGNFDLKVLHDVYEDKTTQNFSIHIDV